MNMTLLKKTNTSFVIFSSVRIGRRVGRILRIDDFLTHLQGKTNLQADASWGSDLGSAAFYHCPTLLDLYNWLENM